MDEESIDFTYKYLVPQHMLANGFEVKPLFIATNTNPCRYKSNNIYKFPEELIHREFSFITSFLRVDDKLGDSFYLCNFILDLKEMDSFRNPKKINEKLPFKYSHYSSPKKIDIENGLKILSMPQKLLNCRDFDVLSIQNKKKLKYFDSKNIIYKWLGNKTT